MGDLTIHPSYNSYHTPKCSDGIVIPPSLGSLGSVPSEGLGGAAPLRSIDSFLLSHVFVLWPLMVGVVAVFPVPKADAPNAPFLQRPRPPPVVSVSY